MHKSIGLLFSLVFVTAALAGCHGGGHGEEGSASIYVKDAPTDDFDEIHVVFTKVEVHAAGSDSDDEGDDGDGGEWLTLYENSTGQDIDLLATADPNKAAFLGEANLSDGRYTQIRIHTTAAYGIDSSGNRTDFNLAPTPLKVVRSFEVNASMETQIILDFDLDRSIIKQGPQGYRMTPVIGKTIVNEVEDDESGAEVHEEGEVTEV